MRYPLVKQRSLKDCGPCSLASIIIYYKGYISVDTLSLMMKTTKNGTTAYDLIETAKKIGFDSKGIKRENLNDIFLPVICHLKINNYYHYVVLYKIDYKKNRVLIGDPASKLKYISFDDFYKMWTNILIILKPIKILPKIKPCSYYTFLKKIIIKNKKNFLLIILLSNLFMMASFISTYILKYIIDNIYKINYKIIIFFIFIYIIKCIISFIKNQITIKTSKKININLTNDLISSILNLPYPYYKNHTTGEVISRYNDIDSVKITINSLINIIVQIPLVIISLLYFLNIESKIWMTIFLTIIINLLIYLLFNNKVKDNIIKYKDNKALFNSKLVECINNYETIKGINIKDIIGTKLDNLNKEVENIIYEYESLINRKDTIYDITNTLSIIIILIISINIRLSTGNILIVYIFYNYLLTPLVNICDLILNYKESGYIIRKLDELNIKEIEEKIIPNKYDIKINYLNYSIGINKILNNINLDIKHGTKLFIYGESGSGKSTLVKLIKGYYKTNNIYIGNTKINKCIKNKIIYVSQSQQLFTDTLKNNMFSNKDIKEVMDMCFINMNPNTYIEEDGFNLSGGEKSRVILARSLLRDFEILIIDEVLENIEIEKERMILKNIIEKYKNKTIIFISHRNNNIDLFDKVYKIERNNKCLEE